MYAKAAAFGDFHEVGDVILKIIFQEVTPVLLIDMAHLMEKIINIGQKTLPEVCMRYVCCNIT